jgi:hypothetical protein
LTIEAVGAAARAGERQHLSLDGTWRFRLDGAGDWRQVKVPAPWQAAFADLRHASGRAVYARQLSIPQSWRGRQLVLCFGAVNYLAEIRLNGRVLAAHEGGYLPFEVVLPDSTPAESALEVHVTLPTGDSSIYPDFPFGEIPHGKQSWYGPLGGIWQSVRLEARHPAHMSHVGIRPEARTGAVSFELSAPPAALRAEIGITVFDAAGRAVAAGETTVSGPAARLELEVADPLLWSPDAPNLYRAEIQLARNGELLDRRDESFGFRTIESRDGKFFLNGEPLYLRGALDQDYYPQDICTPPSLAFLEDQALKAKELGLNLLRCHIKVPDPRYYEVADRLGLLVWTEIPNVQYFTKKSAQRLRDTMEGILHRDGNHPSIIAWTIINEDWGTRLIENADHRAWLKETYDWLKAKDPTRLVVDNSACIPNFHVKTDINDYHYYRSVPERRGEWEKLTEEFAAAASWTWSPHGDADRRGGEPLVVSEFGVWGLPNPKQLIDNAGKEPWWFETGGNWGDGVAYPHGAENRFRTYHLDRIFGSFDNFITAVQWYQFGNLKYQIESMRAHQSIMGYVITELTDVHWESNGLLDLERNPRVFHDRFAEINADTVIVPQLAHHAGYAGDTIALRLKIAAGGKAVPDATLSWTLESLAGALDVPATEPLAVSDLGAIEIRLPVGPARIASIGLELTAGGKTLASNSIDVAVYAARPAPKGPMLATTDPRIEALLRGLGYVVTSPDQAQVIVKHALGPDDIEMLRHGAHYLVLADESVESQRNLRTDPPRAEPPTMPAGGERPRQIGAEQQVPNIGLHRRDGTIWRGDWIASFSWLRRDGAFAAIPGGPMLDVSFDKIVPHHVMTGFRSWEYEGLVHAGVVVGWLHKPAATIAERQVGKGWLVATTFRLLDQPPGTDPVAAALLDGLITLAAARKEG